MTTRLVLVRHAESVAGRDGRFVGASDVDLSDRGREHAAKLAARLRGVALDVIFSSPLLRCTQTADAVAAGRDMVVKISDDLRELDFGEWENRTPDDIKRTWPDVLAKWRKSDAVRMPGGESDLDLRRRIERWRDTEFNAHKGQTVLVVTHGGPILWFARLMLSVPRETMHDFKIDPASVSVLHVSEARARLRTWNDTSHFSDPLRDPRLLSRPGLMGQLIYEV